jgi:hypothetical protein
MHGYYDLPLVPPLMLTVIDAAPLLHEPFSECGALHCSTPAGYPILPRTAVHFIRAPPSRPVGRSIMCMFATFARTSLDLNQGKNR